MSLEVETGDPEDPNFFEGSFLYRRVGDSNWLKPDDFPHRLGPGEWEILPYEDKDEIMAKWLYEMYMIGAYIVQVYGFELPSGEAGMVKSQILKFGDEKYLFDDNLIVRAVLN